MSETKLTLVDNGTVDFSVVICTYNRAGLLTKAIDSVLNTTGQGYEYELIVVDNGSSDGTKDLAAKYQAFPQVKFVVEPELGLSKARNRGIKIAKGRYVLFLDDDGQVAPGWLQSYKDALDLYPDAMGLGGKVTLDCEGAKGAWMDKDSEKYFAAYDHGEEVRDIHWIPGGNMMWKKSALVQMGGFDTRFGRKGSTAILGGEESELVRKAKKLGGEFFYVPTAEMFHFVPKSRLTYRYMATRWFGQGVCEVRYLVSAGTLPRSRGVRNGFDACWRQVRNLKRMARGARRRDQKEMARVLLSIIKDTGSFLESIRYAAVGLGGESEDKEIKGGI